MAAGALLAAMPCVAQGMAADTRHGAQEMAALRAFVAAQREASTIAPGFATWHLPGSHLRDDSASYSVEAVIAPAFALWRGRVPGVSGLFQLDAVPFFMVRRSDGIPSNPVRSPDYRPRVTLYHLVGAADESGQGSGPEWGTSWTLEHHSNGQSGSLLAPDGSGPNTVDGSFSLWSVAAGLHWHGGGLPLPAHKTLRLKYVHIKEGVLGTLYPDWILSLGLRSEAREHSKLGRFGGRAYLVFEADWMPRTRDDRPQDWKPSPVSGMITGFYTPLWAAGAAGAARPLLGDATLFARFQAGSDPYNINFARNLLRLDAGLAVALGR